MTESTRRVFLQQLAVATGAVVLMPVVTSCGGAQGRGLFAGVPGPGSPGAPPADVPGFPLPLTQPADWNAVEYNTMRGNAGGIPESYLGDVNGPNGSWDHVGKHLPYVPEVDGSMVPDRFLAIMWGDPDLGHTPHPNAPKRPEEDYPGHWYNWIRVRKATSGEAEELQSTFVDWPGTGAGATGAYAVFGGGSITDNAGKNTIYLVRLPSDVRSGDLVRIYAHCLTHGEYVDFLQVP